MICEKCCAENVYGAKYCAECGNEISDIVKKEAYEKTFWGKVDKIEEVYNTLTLSKITSSIVFKAFVLIAIILLAGIRVFSYGTQMKVLDGESYSVSYNKVNNEYYVMAESDEIVLDVFIPYNADLIAIKGYDESGACLLDKKYTKTEYQNEAEEIKKGEYNYLNIISFREGKDIESIRVVMSE